MVNRDLIRGKVVQLTYSYYMKGEGREENSMVAIETELDESLAKAYGLYNYMLALIAAVTEEAGKYYDIETARAKREGRELPSGKFVNNRFAMQLEENDQLAEYLQDNALSWNDNHDIVNKVYLQIVSSQFYKDYIDSDNDDYESDRELWRKAYKTIIADNSDIDEALEEMNLYWNGDREIVDSFVLKTIKKFNPANKAKQELLPQFDEPEDRDFARRLLRATIINAKEYQQYISEASRNWDFNRLAFMDVVLMQIAIAEMMTFPSIPVQVTINEFVDMAKIYSTPQSGGYVNAMLDNIAHTLINNKKLKKVMTGNNTERDTSAEDDDEEETL